MTLCKAFIKTMPYGSSTEEQYVVLPDGTVKHCIVQAPTIHLGKHKNGKPATWTVIDSLPADIEFIGNYPIDLIK